MSVHSVLWPSIATPKDEAEGVKNLQAHLHGLESSVQAWEAGLRLYQLSKSPPPTISHDVARRWRFIACHECVLELFHLRARLGNVQSVLLRRCPSIRAWIDIAALRSARKKLDEYFPDIEPLRHAIAHAGENEAHPELHSPDGMFALTGFREPDVFSKPYQGHLRRLVINDLSLRQIAEVVDEFLSGFSQAAVELERQGHIE